MGREYDVRKGLATSMRSLEEIERAIEELEPQDFDELCAWLERREQEFDARIKADLAAGRVDSLIDRALEQERNGETRPL